MTLRFCPTCAEKLVTQTSPGGIPRRVCPACHGEDADRTGRGRRAR